VFYSEFHPKGEIELVPQPELTLSGSVHCLEAPLCPFHSLTPESSRPSPGREGGREGGSALSPLPQKPQDPF